MMDVVDHQQSQVVPGAGDPLEIQTNMMMGMGVEMVDDLGPEPRDRCNTWPLQRPTGDLSHHTSPLIHEEIPEEGSIEGSHESIHNAFSFGTNGACDSPNAFSPVPSAHAPSASPCSQLGNDSSNAFDGAAVSSKGGAAAAANKNNARRNAWGNMSYADLITQAILSSPEKRLTLSQVYDWMVQNVPYFRDKGDSNSSAGWKNSIRHNLSLHSRFMRIQNEGAGKSSWWVINPDAKPGKAQRRRAQTAETKVLEKKRGRVKKKLEAARQAMGADGISVLSPAISESNGEYFDGSLPPFNTGEFRTRSDSNLSNYSLGSNSCAARVSPKFDEFDSTSGGWGLSSQAQQELFPEIVDMARDMRLESQQQQSAPLAHHQPPSHYMRAVEPKPPPPYNAAQQQISGVRDVPVLQPSPVKMDGSQFVSCASQQRIYSPVSMAQQMPPDACSVGGAGARQVPLGRTPIKSELPAYQELFPTSMSQLESKPMLREALQKAQQLHHHPHPGMAMSNGMGYPHASCHMGVGPPTSLPQDISDINYDLRNLRELECVDVDAVIRHELQVDGTLDFNMDTYGNV